MQTTQIAVYHSNKVTFEKDLSIVPGTLTVLESKDLADKEQIISKGRKVFVQVGQALIGIRDKKLYRASYSTFEEYCDKKWQFCRSYAHRVIEAAGVYEVLKDAGHSVLPESESHVRGLIGLSKTQQEKVWNEVVKEASHEAVTAKLIRQISSKYKKVSGKTSRSHLESGVRKHARNLFKAIHAEQWQKAAAVMLHIQLLIDNELERKSKDPASQT